MSMLQKNYRVRGLGLERLLEKLEERGITLYDVARQQKHAITFSCPLPQCAVAEEIAQSLGFTLEELPPQGLLRRLMRLRAYALLWAVAFVFALVLLGALQFIWQIDIRGAGMYQGEVRTLLQEEGIHPGLLRRSVNIQKLCNDLLYRLPRIAWARAEISGVTLRIDITQGVPMPQIEAGGAAGDLVADVDGIITSIQVYSGTAAVKAGDAVRAGDVLIYGREDGAYQNAVTVHARGSATARIWRKAQASVPAYEMQGQPTGEATQQTVWATPWLRVADRPAPDYLTSDVETVRIPLGGAWLPLWLEKVTYQEVALQKTPRDLGAAQSEAGALAMQKLLSFCHIDEEMIDKAVNYSMIDGETVLATATAELLAEISRFQPYSN